jgi:hypothetical protein
MKYSSPVVMICLGALFVIAVPLAYAQEPTKISRIEVRAVTGTTSVGVDSGTDANVYLGIGGREFNLKTFCDDFEPNPVCGDTFIFGEAFNVLNAPNNNINFLPASPNTARNLTLTAAFAFPVYIRMSELRDDDWLVQRVEVRIFSGTGIDRSLRGIWVLRFDGVDELFANVTLGRRFGFRLYLSPVRLPN